MGREKDQIVEQLAEKLSDKAELKSLCFFANTNLVYVERCIFKS